MIQVDIDKYSGFCFGVKKAIATASGLLEEGHQVYCVGDIVHNEAEAERLKALGMHVITKEDLSTVDSDATVLFRAHGEPPASYAKVNNTGSKLTDATCPVVLKLQERIRKAYALQKKQNGQLVIYGQRGHAEVVGLSGQTNNEAIVIEDESEIEQLDFARPIEVFAQTTKNPEAFQQLVKAIKVRSKADVQWHNTTCKQVTGRVPRIKGFAANYPLLIFVGGKKSSNARVLFAACKEMNANAYFVSSEDDVKAEWLHGSVSKVGVCGATSTPHWLMERVAARVRELSTR
ncbi:MULTISPECIES: 4-hydroxy-3-methylbut-2-enyl diphosphate reductase [unclassified Carboxylicivirga]|uniref:4-hydroxy-3-methylbut-2-enyl diphosphate reductase n=1 Tax=Carboxylicivirga TaxID=1628153 RepID=UPI003D333133